MARVATVALGGALAWNLVRDAQLGHLTLPYLWAFAAACLLGAAAAAVSPPRRAVPRAALAAAAVVLAVALALPAGGLVERHARVAPTIPGAAVAGWAVDQPGFDHGQAIHFAGTVLGQLSGDRLQNKLVLLPPDASCAELRATARNGLLVVADPDVFRELGVRTPAACVDGLDPSYEAPGVRVFGRLRGDG
jgi:hypothetical protein